MTPSSLEPLGGAASPVRDALSRAAGTLERDGISVPALEGKLLRPAVAWALLPARDRDEADEDFWMGGLAVQMVHEASLLHDDILDGAETRRSRPSVMSQKGLGSALVLGDLYLTGAYRAAARSDDPAFLQVFIEAVERTVAGELLQERHRGRALDADRYLEMIRGKTGELFGAAAVLAGTRAGVATGAAREIGCRIGALYQMVDDFLDYCPGAGTGKPPFQDYRQEKYTFVLAEAGVDGFGASVEEIHGRLHARQGRDGSVMDRALARLDRERAAVVAAVEAAFGEVDPLAGVLQGWMDAARRGLSASEDVDGPGLLRPAGSGVPTPAGTGDDPEEFVSTAARAVGAPASWGRYFGHHSKSFRFSARLFPPGPRSDVEGVYAFCRFTDDLVDEAQVPPARARARLEAWRSLARRAYAGEPLNIPLLDAVMGRLRDSDSPFDYVDDLLTGVGMDLDHQEYGTLNALEVYTYRVASVVGGWITELFGLHDRALLQRAYALGHAMQLTNILRDVGEDWRRGRLYLPLDLMDHFGVDRQDIARLARDGRVTTGYRDLLEHLMGVADRHYASAAEAIPLLPSFYRRPVAVATRVYGGIHDEIRANGYNNGTLRAHTSTWRKLRLAGAGLWGLRQRPVDDLEPVEAELMLAARTADA